jgi:integrase
MPLGNLPVADYRDGLLFVTRSIVDGVKDKPKTKASAAPVPVVPSLAFALTQHRMRNGNPESGPIFASGLGTPMSLNNVRVRQIMPVLNRCLHCHKPKTEHVGGDHHYQRDPTMPTWHGWHAFRRGLATNLHRLGVSDKVNQGIMRHSNVAMTQDTYIKTVTADSVAAMDVLEKSQSLMCAKRAPRTTDSNPTRVN